MWNKEAYKERERARAKRNEIQRRKQQALSRRRTNEGRKAANGYVKKDRARRKAQGFEVHKISLPLKVPFEWHHVNKRDVVACPRNIHKFVHHVCGDGKVEGILG